MVNQAQFDMAAFSGVKPSMDASLGDISASLEQYLSAPNLNETALDRMRSELRRLSGALTMAHLDGVVVFCAELENVLNELSSNPTLVSAMHRDVMRRSLLGLTHFLDSLSRGSDNVSLRLFPLYQELQQLRGLEMAFETDLFFPNVVVQLPVSVLGVEKITDAATRIKAARSQYQQGLMRCLRQDDVPVALQSMQGSIDIVISCTDQNENRAFWWVANGLLDCVKLDGLPPELNARKLFGRIDQQIRAVIEGTAVDSRPSMYEMLYLIGRSHSVSDRVDQIKQLYVLDRYLPELSAVPAGEVAQILSLMHDQFRVAEESWEFCTQGDVAACDKFIENVGLLAIQSEKLDHNTLQPLVKQIKSMSTHISDPEHARMIAMEMAMSLLLLNSGIEHYSHLGSGFQEQARILSERMRAALTQQPTDAQQLEELVDLHCQMEQNDVTVSLVNEMLLNLQHVEQGLNAFFGDAAKRGELAGLQRLMGQIHGGLHILSLAQAERLLISIKEMVHSFEGVEAIPKPAECHALARAVSALENCLQRQAHGQNEDTEAMRASLEELSTLKQTPALVQTSQAEQPGTAPTLQRPLGEDQELLDVFLEEAREVLGIMQDNLEICQLHPNSLEPLITIRRGFHTLKGSGRMVGLTDLGEVAWAIERALNKWLQEKKPTTPNLLQFINQAAQAFAEWVESLNSQGGVRIEAADLFAMAQKIEQGADFEVVTQAKVAEVEKPQAELIEPIEVEQVSIGEITLSTTLFNIASEEAKQNALALQSQLAELRTATPLRVQYDFMRSAHTLAGVNRSMGFKDVATLAIALEGWLQARIEQKFTLSDKQWQMLELSITALGKMAQSICDKQMPQSHNDLANQLLADKDNLVEEVAIHAVDVVATPITQQRPATSEPRQTSDLTQVPKSQVRDDVDEQLLPVFLEEADDLLPKIGVCMRAWREQPDDQKPLNTLTRLLHTVKGSARMAGAMRIGEIAHGMEDRVQHAARRNEQPDYWDELDSDFDQISNLIEGLRSGEVSTGTHTTEPKFERRAEAGAERALHSVLRVRSDVIDRLVNEASEISVARSRMETEMRAFKEGLLELTSSVTRLRKQLREIEIQAESQMQARVTIAGEGSEQFDPLELDRFTRLQELTRFMSEGVHDVQTVQQSLLKNVDETAAAMSAQGRLNRELQQGLMNVRMVPFSSISERLYRIVRQTGKELNKRANLELSGTSVELDRSVLDKMTAPFEHLLRNAMAHGLETPEERERLGKPAIGEIHLSLQQVSNEVVFEFRDDGAGLDMARLQQKAVASGLMKEGEIISPEQAIQMIFMPGITTAKEVTEISGRGVGLDVVRSEVSALGGRLDVTSEVGKGVRFMIHLPLTLAVTKTLMVRAANEIYAIPATMISQVQQLKPSGLEAVYQTKIMEWQGKKYPLYYLPRLLGDENTEPVSCPYNAFLLLHSGENRIALHVDELIGNQEVVVKNIGPQLARLPGIAGATVTGNGAVTLIINPIVFAQQMKLSLRAEKVDVVIPPVRKLPLVMVVDDSLTVRKITTRLLTRFGYQVVTAKDGVDAMEQLVDLSPAVMLLDVEMPRMDGFELTKRLRQDSKTKDLPIIMITSRTADKHRNYAIEIGVNEYLGKPYQEEELLAHINRFAPLLESGTLH
jgi:chemosensory pili system protein ChpA (sensor histidine kinase/response regulator)